MTGVATPATERLVFVVEGLHCAGCAQRIERALSGLDGIAAVRMNSTTRRLNIAQIAGHAGPARILSTIRDLGYDAHAPSASDTSPDDGSRVVLALAVSGFAMMNVMGFSIAVWSGLVTDMSETTRQLMHLISAAIVLPATAFSGRIFFRSALRDLKHRRTSMDVSISLAILAPILVSIVGLLQRAEHVYFDAAISLIFFLLIGRWLDASLRRRSSNASSNLRAIVPDRAQRLRPDGVAEDVPINALRDGDRVLVKPGQRIPADGTLIGTPGFLDESILTGESRIAARQPGEIVLAGSLAHISTLTLSVTASGAGTRLSEIADLTEAAEERRGRIQEIADRWSSLYAPIVLAVAVAGFAVWWLILGSPIGEAVMIAVAVLIVTCPCAAGLATPAVAARAAALMLERGAIIRDPGALERLAQIDQIIFDKTGTLTVPQIADAQEICPEDLDHAAAIAGNSAHPIAAAIAGISDSALMSGVTEIAGAGLQAADGSRLGSRAFAGADARDSSQSHVWFHRPDHDPVPINTTEALRQGAAEAVSKLQGYGLGCSIASGDHPDAVGAVATQIGIQDWQAGMSPEDKITAMSRDGNSLALMVGDGLNDAPALAAAHVSMSPASAIDVTRNTADIILLTPDLSAVGDIYRLSRRARALIVQNLGFSAVYNVLTVPLALCGYLTPAIAALLMSSSSIAVMLNALRLRLRS